MKQEIEELRQVAQQKVNPEEQQGIKDDEADDEEGAVGGHV